jgi:hypothetical protein
MIASYNRRQIVRAIGAILLGCVCYLLAWLFFRYLPPFIASQLGYRWSATTAIGVALAALAVITWSGYRTWKTGGGLRSYHQSALYHELGEDTAGAIVVDHYAQQLTAPAFAISQIFLAGPLLLFRARTLCASLLSNKPEMEQRLVRALSILRAANKWQAMSEHPGLKTEILCLAQMGQIDFSAHKGTPRIKAHLPPHGT